MTIWPTPRDADDRTPFEKTIAFCSTVGGEEFLFDRGKFADGALHFSYVAKDKGIEETGVTESRWVYPEGASSIPALSTTLDFTEKNEKIYDFLSGQTKKNLPGYGSSLAIKFGQDSDQILTTIFDYIRSTNLYDLSSPNSAPYTARPFMLGELSQLGVTPPTNTGSTLRKVARPTRTSVLGSEYQGSVYIGQVVPIKITKGSQSTRGLGRFPVITGATLVVMATEPKDKNLQFSGSTRIPFEPVAPLEAQRLPAH